MFAVAEMGEFFSGKLREEHLLEIEDDLLCVPGDSDQGVHALQGMLANSILYENSTRHHPSDLNQALRALERSPQRMADLFGGDVNGGEKMSDISKKTVEIYKPAPFLDQGMLSFYMHAEQQETGDLGVPMTGLIEDDEISLVPSVYEFH